MIHIEGSAVDDHELRLAVAVDVVESSRGVRELAITAFDLPRNSEVTLDRYRRGEARASAEMDPPRGCLRIVEMARFDVIGNAVTIEVSKADETSRAELGRWRGGGVGGVLIQA